LEDGRVAGFEALMRWNHPTRGELSPKDFLSLAEETGLIVAAGRFALEEAARELASWQTYFPVSRPLFLSVNVSSRQFLDGRILDDVLAALKSSKVEPGTLKLELTESLLMENPERAAALLKKLSDAGVGLAIDDFGTGFSSLSYLQRFPADTIKIDRSFVTMMGADSEASVIVRSIISLAEALDVDVVAEGAESEADVEKLKGLGCRYAQGFHFGAGMTAAEARDFIARHWED
jgi:EAL domain-containing protein (putative c-di-GMP-specific phosphodiesterase class I)